jgi:hypothetical protein
VLAPNSPQREAVTALAAKVETAGDIPQAAGSLVGEPTSPPRMAPARGPPLWEAVMERHRINDPLAQPEPAYEFDQRIAW